MKKTSTSEFIFVQDILKWTIR